MVKADFHLHTTASDGTWHPAELVDAAKQAGLAMIAVTDHDTTAGIGAAQERGKAVGVEVVAGVELSARNQMEEVHLVGLGIDTAQPELQQSMARLRDDRTGRAQAMVEKLCALGVPVSLQQVQNLAGAAAIGRPHLARALVEAGHVASVTDAFDQYLAEGRPAFVPRAKLSPQEAIATIHNAGGVAVCAHPGLLRDDNIIPELAAAGLDAIEVYHSKHTPAHVERYLQLAKRLRLLVSAGSDCHGPGYRAPVLLGTVSLDLVAARRLLAACARYVK